MEEKKFTGFNIPDGIADQEEREFLELVNKIIMLAQKKDYSIALLASIDEENNVTVVMGCMHCIEFLLNKVIKTKPQFRDVLIGAIVSNMRESLRYKQDSQGTDSGIKQLISDAKKNTPAGN